MLSRKGSGRGAARGGTSTPTMRVAVATACVLIAAVLAIAPASRPARAAEPPNIVVILTDDQRAGTLRWMPTVRSELVRRGTTFTKAFAPTPTCCPSRASLLTGLYAPHTGVWANSRSDEATPIGGWPAFAAGGNEERTIATQLTDRYRTMLIGKYINDYSMAEEGYVPPGWDEWHAFLGRNASYFNYRLVHTDGSITEFGESPADYSTDVLADLAVSAIHGAPPRKPLMLFFTPYAPHGPSTPAPRHRDLDVSLGRYDVPSVNEDDVSDKPPWIQQQRRIRMARITVRREDVYASLQAVDEAVAQILEALEGTDRLEDTLIVFTSDNGSSWGEHRIHVGNKYVPYMNAMHVPLVVRWDGEVEAGARDTRLAANVDVPVTLARAAGVPLDDADGRSLFRRTGHEGIPLGAADTFSRTGDGLAFDRPAYCGYLTRRYLYTFYASGHEELYDLVDDPYELENLEGLRRFRAVRTRLRGHADVGCTPRPPGF